MHEPTPNDTALVRQAHDADLTAEVARVSQKLAEVVRCDPEALRTKFELLVSEIKECTCAELNCEHNCNSCTVATCAYGTGPYYCEDCFAFVRYLPTFCHCAQLIVIA